MKNLFLLVILIVISAGFTSAQTIKTVEARQLEDIDTRIKQTQKEADQTATLLEAVTKKYSDEYRETVPALVKIKNEYKVLNERLTSLFAERKRLAEKKLTMALPNNQIDLLKILILQNERLLDLLNNQIPKNN